MLAKRAEWELTGLFSEARDAVAEISRQLPDIVVCEARTAQDAIATVEQLSAANQALKLLVVVPEVEIPLLQVAQPHPVLASTAPAQEWFATISDLVNNLSDRERVILRLIARGYTNKEIASQLELSIKSVEKYKTRSLEKLGLRSRVEIVQYAIDRGWMK